MKFQIPGYDDPFEIRTILMDANGTLCIGGKLIEGVIPRIRALRDKYKLVLCSGDARGDAADIARFLEIDFAKTVTGKDKADIATIEGADKCAAIGNGFIDLQLIQEAKIGIAVLQAEGAHIQTLLAADIVVPNINDGLDLFVDAQRLIATLRR